MADTENAAPKKIIVDANELVALYERLYERQWNKETNAFRDPINVARSLLQYGKVAALRILDLFGKVGALEERIVELERFKEETEAHITAAMSQFSAMIAEGQAMLDKQTPVEAPTLAIVPPPADDKASPPTADAKKEKSS